MEGMEVIREGPSHTFGVRREGKDINCGAEEAVCRTVDLGSQANDKAKAPVQDLVHDRKQERALTRKENDTLFQRKQKGSGQGYTDSGGGLAQGGNTSFFAALLTYT